MNIKKIITYAMLVIVITGIMFSPLIQACEETESKNEEDKKNTEIKESVKKSSLFTDGLSVSSSFVDKIFERFPILDQIIQMLLDLMLNWLTGFDYSNAL